MIYMYIVHVVKKVVLFREAWSINVSVTRSSSTDKHEESCIVYVETYQ